MALWINQDADPRLTALADALQRRPERRYRSLQVLGRTVHDAARHDDACARLAAALRYQR